MKSVVYSGAEGPLLRVLDEDTPTTTAHQVLVRVDRAGVCGSDLTLLRGRGALSPGQPLGHEFVGTIVGGGSETDPASIGKRVAGMAFSGCGGCEACRQGRPVRCAGVQLLACTWAQFVVADERACVPVPVEAPVEVAALLEPATVAQHAVARGGSLSGAAVAVLGAGPIGLLVARAALRAGASRVAMVATSLHRQDEASAVGADALLRVNEDHLSSRVREVLGRRPEMVFDAAGAPDSISSAVRIAPVGATVVIVAANARAEGRWLKRALHTELNLRFSLAYERSDFDRALPMVVEDAPILQKLISHSVDLPGFPDLVSDMVAGIDHCKVLLRPW